jgi:site-specific recombinase XerD
VRPSQPSFSFQIRGAPFTVAGLAKLIERAGIAAKIGFKVHPHMLRHAAGFVLANKGTDIGTSRRSRYCNIFSAIGVTADSRSPE